MIDLFITVSGLVIVVNIIYSIIPTEKYSKYCKIVIGIITTLAIINIFSDVSDFDYNYDIDEQISFFDEKRNIVFDDLVKENLENNIMDLLKADYNDKIKTVTIEYDMNEIKSVIIEVSRAEYGEEIKNKVALYCDINSERVVVKYI